MTVKSDREINRAVPIGGIFILLMTGVAFVVGALSNVMFFNATGQISIVAAGEAGIDGIIPAFLNAFTDPWFVTIFMVILMAAGMSTISSQFHAMGDCGRKGYRQLLEANGQNRNAGQRASAR